MTSNKPDLLPCPFCGGKAEILRMRAQNIFFAWCSECETRGDYYGIEEEAVAAWNRRDGERTCQMEESDFAGFAQEYKGLYACCECGEETAVLACVNEDGDAEWVRPRFCGYCGGKVVEEGDGNE